MTDNVLGYLNQEFADKGVGLVYEYTAFNTIKTTMDTSSLSVKIGSSVSMALDVQMLVCPTAADVADDAARNSFESLPMTALDETQWRIGSLYMPAAPTSGVAEHFAQYCYWLNSLRDGKPVGVKFTPFDTEYSQYCMTLQRNAILEKSGMALNNSKALFVEGTLDGLNTGHDVYIYLRHLRRAVCFLNTVQLET